MSHYGEILKSLKTIEYTNMLAKQIVSIKFIYYKRSANELTDKISKDTICVILKKVVINELLFIYLFF